MTNETEQDPGLPKINKLWNKAFVIGNGASRKDFDLDTLVDQDAPIFGCNALYRDFWPHYLIAIDKGIIEEIEQSDFPLTRLIVPPYDQQFEPAEFNPLRPRENAGMIALRSAIGMGIDHLYCLGFDFLINDQVESVSNMYSDTNNYGPMTKTSYADTLKRVKYFDWFCSKHPEVQFHMVFPRGTIQFHPLKSANVFGLYYDNLKFEEH